MLWKKILFFILINSSTLCYANNTNLITAVCPQSDMLVRTNNSDPWASYLYSGHTPINFAEVGNQLYFSGKTSAPTAGEFYSATWTDMSFLCLYNKADTLVIFETQLAPFVQKCYFENAADRPRDECDASDPSLCILTCEVAN